MLNNNKNKISKSKLIFALQKSKFSTSDTYEIGSEKEKKDMMKDIDSLIKKSRITVIVIEHK